MYNTNRRVITVLLINFREHFHSRLAKDLQVRAYIDIFYDKLRHLWWWGYRAMDFELIEASDTIRVLDSLRQGVMYIFDHHASPLVA